MSGEIIDGEVVAKETIAVTVPNEVTISLTCGCGARLEVSLREIEWSGGHLPCPNCRRMGQVPAIMLRGIPALRDAAGRGKLAEWLGGEGKRYGWRMDMVRQLT